MATSIASKPVLYGDPRVLDHEILRSVVGSGVHGIAIEGTDDHDEMGVYVEPPDYVLGIKRERGDFISRTKPEGVRSGPGDVDLVVYSLRKYLHLAVKGNPTALLPLYAPEDSLLLATDLGRELRRHRDWFLSQEAVERFLGYMNSQHERMMGQGKRNRVPSRPELVEKYGWDVKYGSHALRLAYQGFEIASEGTLTLPLEPSTRERVLSVKRGEVDREEVSAEIGCLAGAVRKLLDDGTSAVPPYPDRARIHDFCIMAHKETWGW